MTTFASLGPNPIMPPIWNACESDPRRWHNLDLTDFLFWFLRTQPFGAISCPEQPGTLSIHESVITLCLFRQRQFQAELVILKPDAPPWPGEHRHPNVDSYEVAWYNAVDFTRNGEVVNKPDLLVPVFEEGGPLLSMKPCIRLLPTDFHGTPPLKNGGALISVQMWLNNVPPTSVGLDWIGEPVTPGHAKQLEDNGNSGVWTTKL